MTESPLFELDSVVVTPHLGATTAEAQDKAGDTIAEQVLLALAGDFVPFAVNVDASEASARRCARSCRWPSSLGRLVRVAVREVARPPSRSSSKATSAATTTRSTALFADQGHARPDQRRTGVASSTPPTSRATAASRSSRPTTRRQGLRQRASRSAAAVTRSAARSSASAANPPRDGRRPHGRRAAGRSHVGGAQRRPTGHDRLRRHRARCAPASTSTTWTSVVRPTVCPR